MHQTDRIIALVFGKVGDKLMIGISIATKWEYETTLEHYAIKENERFSYPYGEYFIKNN